jgi:hypothetical protein
MRLDPSYEVQVYARGGWKIVAIFDDRRLALIDARLLRRGRRYSAIRVTEETYDRRLEKFRSRTISRYSRWEEQQRKLRPQPRLGSYQPDTIARSGLLAWFAERVRALHIALTTPGE